MRARKNPNEIFWDIKKEIPLFDKKEIVEYTKWAIPILYDAIKNDEIEKLKINCQEKLIKKLSKMKFEYRISEKIDTVSIQYVELYDFIKTQPHALIKLYISVYLCDELKNNTIKQPNNNTTEKKYWNDIWIVTFGKKNTLANIKTSNCPNCGGLLKYDERKNALECEHCKNIILGSFEESKEWEIIDIELGK